MACLLIIAHAPLASTLKQVAAHTFAEAAEQLRVFDVPPHMPPEDIVTGTSGPEPRHGALGRLAARAGLTGEAVRRAWRGVRVAPEKIAAWNS